VIAWEPVVLIDEQFRQALDHVAGADDAAEGLDEGIHA
jgi:hypothetical protein